MSLDYYLFCREKYDNILKYLEEINNLYDDVIRETNTSNNLLQEEYYNIFLLKFNDKSLETTKENTIKLKKICDENIKQLCQHNFEKDLIDITPHRSENIIYCTICGSIK